MVIIFNFDSKTSYSLNLENAGVYLCSDQAGRCLLMQCEVGLAFWDPLVRSSSSSLFLSFGTQKLQPPEHPTGLSKRILGYNLRCFTVVTLGDKLHPNYPNLLARDC